LVEETRGIELMDIEKMERYSGCLTGLAAGDALGTTLEFLSPGTFTPIEDMQGGGPFKLQPGQWTDDTSMALCLAESLIEKQAFDPVDQLQRYCRWFREGYLSSNSRCFDIGLTVAEALRRFEKTGEPYCGSTDPQKAGNGSLMRLAPVAMAYAGDPQQAFQFAAHSSQTTHGAPAAVDACRYYAGLLVGALEGAEKDEILSPLYSPQSDYYETYPLHPDVYDIALGSFKHRHPPQIKGSGYVIRSLEAALWAFFHSTSFREGCLLAVNLGDDADTTGAVYGQIAGAYYGINGIPEEWRSQLTMAEEIRQYAQQLLHFRYNHV
jgi:ADP-ribosyl-[dinitrogen reductase] hydrolase